MLPTKFRVSWPFGSGEEVKIDFQDVHLGISDRDNFNNSLSTSHPQASYPRFESIGLSIQEKKRSRRLPWGSSWISDWNDLSYF